MNITQHFTLAELVASDYAIRHGISNVPTDPHVTANLSVLAHGLERVRAIIDKPIIISSGYRSEAVNRAVGGSRKSAHLRGLAADFVVPGLSALQVCRMLEGRHEVGFDQLIQEGRWTHIAFPEDNRQPAGTILTAVFKAGQPTTYTK